MALIIWFLALVAAGDVLAYLVGLFVEYEWGGYTSLVVFFLRCISSRSGSLGASPYG